MNKKTRSIFIKFAFMFSVIMIFNGCVIVNLGNYDSVTAKGDLESYEINVGQFSGIKVQGYCEINYYAAGGKPGTVILEVQPNVREYFIVEVVNNDLVLRTKKRVNFPFRKNPVLTVYSSEMNRIVIDGASAFTAHDKITSDSLTVSLRGAGSGVAELDVNHLSVEISGAGNYKLSGRAETAGLILSGTGDLDALALVTRDASVDLTGAGTIKVHCNGFLNIRANGLGTVEYRGNPGLNLNRGGLVSIRQVN